MLLGAPLALAASLAEQVGTPAQSGRSAPAILSDASRPEALRAVSIMARCVVLRSRARAEFLLAAPPRSAAEAGVMRSLNRVRSECLQVVTQSYDTIRLQFAIPLLRGALARELYRQRFPGGPPVAVAGLSVPLITANAPNLPQAVSVSYDVAQCVAAAAPGKVHDVVLADVGSEAEPRALRELIPSFSACMTQGSTLTSDPATLRAYLAEALYDWARAQQEARGRTGAD